MPPPVPPSVKLGRMITGKPMFFCAAQASSSECAIAERAEPSPIFVIASLNFSRSSALSIASGEAPISSTPCLFSTPLRCRSSAQFSAVCPPIVGRIASGRSFSMMRSTTCQVIGSM